jgi:hypothetical protein
LNIIVLVSHLQSEKFSRFVDEILAPVLDWNLFLVLPYDDLVPVFTTALYTSTPSHLVPLRYRQSEMIISALRAPLYSPFSIGNRSDFSFWCFDISPTCLIEDVNSYCTVLENLGFSVGVTFLSLLDK